MSSENLYAPPQSDVVTQADHIAGVRRLYSPRQVAVGVLLGGPAGVAYFLHSNFRHLELRQSANLTLLAGAGLLILHWVLGVCNANFVGYPLFAAEIYLSRRIAQSNIENLQPEWQSNWKVFGMAVLCSILSMVLVMLPFFLMNLSTSSLDS